MTVKDELERKWAPAVTDEGTDAPPTGQLFTEPNNTRSACRKQNWNADR